MAIDPKLAKWIRWLKIIESEIQSLVVAKHTFHEIQRVINSNPELHQPSHFYDYLSQTYISHVLIGLRRQLKSDTQSISIARLFEELIQSPQSFSRAYFVEKYKGSILEHHANSDFNKFAQPEMDHIDPNLVQANLKQLRKFTKSCEDFADRIIAHRDKTPPKQLPTFNEVDACIDLLDKLYVHYFLLFHASSMETLLPVWQYDWQAIFRVPWIKSKS